jgi:hypothetical protein
MTRRLAVLWFLVIGFTAVFAIPAFLTHGFMPVPRKLVWQVVFTVIGPGLLSLTVVASAAHCLHRSRLTPGTVAGAVLSFGYFCAVVGAIFWAASEQRELIKVVRLTAPMPPRLRMISLTGRPETALRAARLAYAGWGVRLDYQHADGSHTLYTPSLEERSDRKRRLERQDEAASLLGRYVEPRSQFLRAVGFIYIEALPLIGIPFLLWVKRKARAP